jgi:NADH-quinone oxidoreductase subunit F
MSEHRRVLTVHWDDSSVIPLAGYEAAGGYRGLRAALDMTGAELIDLVKASGLRGRGGAGFPTGLKWSFVPQGTGKPTYVAVNFDESEPGTCNNRELAEREPHALLEGAAIAAKAIGSHTVFIYIRGEYLWQAQVLQRAIDEAYAAGYLGQQILGSDWDLDMVLHRGAGAYICGEETALLSSLEGFRGQPRLRPPFPAVEGLYACPTLINNVETLMNVPHIVTGGADRFRELGTEKSPGTKMFTISGKVERPGNYELPLGTPMRVLLEECAGGVLGGKRLKAWTPGGSSTPFLTDEHLDVPLDFEGVAAAGSLLGTGAVMVMEEDDCMVEAARRLVEFYAHESCGKCTPCREGTWWASRVLGRIEAGYGREDDMPLLDEMGGNIAFRSFCALADGAVSPIASSLRYFLDEFDAHVREGRCPVTGIGPGTTGDDLGPLDVVEPEGDVVFAARGPFEIQEVAP